MIKNIIKSTALVGLLFATTYAQDINVKITNITGYSYFTPFLVATHDHNKSLFTIGSAASSALKMMAEGGDISGLVTELGSSNTTIIQNPNHTTGGVADHLAPGKSTDANLSIDATKNSLSIYSMILPSNDGFIALNNWKVPTTPGVYKVNINAYDAGTKGNSEKLGDMPGLHFDTTASAARGVVDVNASEGFVHIHRGILGDANSTGGISNLEFKHRWLNPIVTVIITVK